MNLMVEGVESYQADLVKHEKRFYMPGGETYVEAIDIELSPIADDFAHDSVISAIRAVQNKEIDYRGFLSRIMEAGTISYTVFLNGKKAIYFGRKGDFHVENFPNPK